MAKTAQKTARRKPKHGKGELLVGGQVGNKGGTGRPPDEFKQLCRDLASGALTIANIQTILADPSHAQFMAALRWATEHGYGKPTEKHELTGKDGGPIETQPQTVDWGALKLVVG